VVSSVAGAGDSQPDRNNEHANALANKKRVIVFSPLPRHSSIDMQVDTVDGVVINFSKQNAPKESGRD
jgi:hypothetical protein